MTVLPPRQPNKCGRCGMDWYDTHTCPALGNSTPLPQGFSIPNITKGWSTSKGRAPKVVYLPLRCSTEGCHRSPWMTIDDVPYCKPHGDEVTAATL